MTVSWDGSVVCWTPISELKKEEFIGCPDHTRVNNAAQMQTEDFWSMWVFFKKKKKASNKLIFKVFITFLIDFDENSLFSENSL